MRVGAVAFLLALVCGVEAETSLKWSSTLKWSSSDRCEFALLPVPVDHSAARTNASSELSLSLYRYMATAATPTTLTLIVVPDTNDQDNSKICARLKRLGQRTSANIYFAFTRLHGGPVNSSSANVEGPSMEPTPCGQLAIGRSAGVTITDDALDAARSCQDWLRASFGGLGSRAYSLEAAARDLAIQIQVIQETTPKNVFVMAVGATSRIVQTYLALDQPAGSSSTPIAGFVFDTPHALHLTATSDAAAGASTSRFLDSCDADETCRRNYAELGVSLRGVVNNLMLQIDNRKLIKSISRCAQSLLDTSFNEDLDLAPSHGVRRFLATIRRQPSLAKLLPVLLFRLHRCHEQDVAVLEGLWYNLQAAVDGVPVAAAPGRGSPSGIDYYSEVATAHTRFIELLNTFSDAWPSDVPTWQELVHSFETSPMGMGEMVHQQPLFCLYSASTSPVCTAMYEKNRKVNASLVLAYPRSSRVAATTDNSVSATGDVLLLASRLSTTGSDAVAAQLYDAWKDNGKVSTQVLVETDSLEETELLAGEIYVSQEGVDIQVGTDGNDALQVLELFLGGKLRTASGKWHMSDLMADSDTASTKELPATLTSTYGKAAVALNLTMLPEDMRTWFPNEEQDPYASHLTLAVNGHGLSVWYVALIVLAAVAVLVLAGCSIRVIRKKRRYQATQTFQDVSTPVA